MAYTSLKFFLFLAVVMLVYFRFPWKQHKWVVLLGASYFFYLLVSYRLVAYIVFTTAGLPSGSNRSPVMRSRLWRSTVPTGTKRPKRHLKIRLAGASGSY